MLPYSHAGTHLVRTDFSDDAAWDALVAAVRTPTPEGWIANVDPISDRTFDAASIEQVVAATPPGLPLVTLADSIALTTPTYPVLLVYLAEPGLARLRAEATSLWAPVNNLQLGNVSWSELVEQLDAAGVWRAP